MFFFPFKKTLFPTTEEKGEREREKGNEESDILITHLKILIFTIYLRVWSLKLLNYEHHGLWYYNPNVKITIAFRSNTH